MVTAKKKGPIGRLPDDLHAMVEEYAKQNGYSMNTVIIMALRMFFNNFNNDQATTEPGPKPAA